MPRRFRMPRCLGEPRCFGKPRRFGTRKFRPHCAMSNHRRMNRTSCHGRTNGRRRPGSWSGLFHRRWRSGCGSGRRFHGGWRLRWRCGTWRRGFFDRHRLVVTLFHFALRVAVRLQIGCIESVQPAQLECDVLVDGAGVRLLLLHSQFREPIENLVSLDFQLSRQLIDSNLFHRKSYQSIPSRRSFHPLGPRSGLMAATFRGALVQYGLFRVRSFRRFVSGGTRVFYPTRRFLFSLHDFRRLFDTGRLSWRNGFLNRRS
jgi:hypothetical protein